LQGKVDLTLMDFWPNSRLFTFCECCQFMHLEKSGEQWNETLYADNPNVWLELLKQDGVRSLRLIYEATRDQHIGEHKTPERMLAGFAGGGGTWLIEARKQSRSEFWAGKWKLGDRDRADRKIWRVSYGRVAINEQSDKAITQPSVTEIADKLKANLTRIAEFARTHDAKSFANTFETAIAHLSGKQIDIAPYLQDIAPTDTLPPVALQLLRAAQVASVFGGMGSWNDMNFDGVDQSIYEDLSEELYSLINNAVVAAANSGM
jgi:hypothetical protein